MNKITQKCLMAIFFFLATSVASADTKLIPPIGPLQIYGYSQAVYDDESGTMDLDRLRVRFKIDSKLAKIFSEVELAYIDKPNNNWLREFGVSKTYGDTTTRVGRIFVAAVYSTPPPFLLKTVKYWSASPFASSAYGMQINGKYYGGKVQILADITGASGKQFKDSANWDRVEVSSRVKYIHSEDLNIAFTTQLSADFKRYGLDAKYVHKNMVLNGGVYLADGNGRTQKSGFLLAEYRVNQYLSLHTQLDRVESANTWTNGVQMFGGENVALTLDYESVDVVKNGRFFGRVQIRF